MITPQVAHHASTYRSCRTPAFTPALIDKTYTLKNTLFFGLQAAGAIFQLKSCNPSKNCFHRGQFFSLVSRDYAINNALKDNLGLSFNFVILICCVFGNIAYMFFRGLSCLRRKRVPEKGKASILLLRRKEKCGYCKATLPIFSSEEKMSSVN